MDITEPTAAELLVGQRASDLPRHELFEGRRVPQPQVIGDQAYIELQALGLSMVIREDGDAIHAVQLHGEGHEGYSAFAGALPAHLGFNASRAEVRRVLGMPVASGEARDVTILGRRPAFDVFVRGGRRLHIEYTDDASAVQLVSITAAGH